MSRAREVGGKWFDVYRNGQEAEDDQLELLASAEDIEIDDLLDESLTQGQVIERLRKALGEGEIPPEVEERRDLNRANRQGQPKCRKCDRVGDSTKHHFVNRWILKELEGYRQLSERSKCTIPLCIDCHRDIHSRGSGSDKSIYEYLDKEERQFVSVALDKFRNEHPKIFNLLYQGEQEVYEARLIQDWVNGKFEDARIPFYDAW